MQATSNMEDHQIITSLREGDEDCIVQLYQLYRQDFVQEMQENFGVDALVAADAWQDAVICFHYSLVRGRLDEAVSPLKTYLFAIAKQILCKKHQVQIHFGQHEPILPEKQLAEPLETFAANNRQKFVAGLMHKVDMTSQSILKLFYFQRLEAPAVAQRLKYAGENEAKTQKLRCLTILKNMVKDQYNDEIL